MLKRYFLSNLIVMIVLNVLVKPAWIFLIDRNVQLTVGHEQYGLYSALLSLSVIFNILLDFGITNYNNRNIAKDNSQIHLSLPNMIVAKMLFSLIYLSVILLVALIFHYNARAMYLLFLLGGIQFVNSFLQFLRSNVSANHDFKLDSLLSVLDKVLMIAICGFLLLYPITKNNFIIDWYLYAQLFAYLIAIVVAVFIINKRYAMIDFSHFSWKDMKSFCLKSIPYALLILLMGIYMRSDSLILERMAGPEVNSVYAEAYRILDALNMIGFLFAGILLPMFTRLISKKGNVNELVQTSANIIIPISLCIVSHSIIYRHEIMFFLDKNADINLPTIYLFVIACFPPFCLMYIYSTLLTANGNIYLLVRIALIGCVLSIGLNLLLIPELKAIGTGMAAFIVQLSVAICSVYFCIKKFKLPINWIWILKFTLVFFFLLGLNWLLYYFNIPLFASILINMVIFIVLVYSIKLWDMAIIRSYLAQYKAQD